MKNVLLLSGPAAGQRVEVHGAMTSYHEAGQVYKLVPLCSHGEVHWFGVLDGADPLALLVAGYAPRVVGAPKGLAAPYGGRVLCGNCLGVGGVKNTSLCCGVCNGTGIQP